MEFKDIVAITGMSGLWKAGAAKANGIIVTNLEDNKSTFASARTHGITTLENISVYLQHDETIELRLVLAEILKQEATNPPVDPKALPADLKAWFKKIVPAFDEERVHQSDMKKIIKWFHILKANGLVKTAEEIKAEEEKATAERAEETEKAQKVKSAEEKPKSEKVAKEKPAAEKVEKEKPAKEKAAKKAK